jgi:hypothetical protein
MARKKPEKGRTNQNRERITSSVVPPDAATVDKVLSLLKDLEDRMARIELHLGLGNPVQEANLPAAVVKEVEEEAEDELESQVGENWFAKIGIVVLALGVVFLLTFPYQDLPPYAPSAIGYFLVGAILLLSRSWKESFQQVSRYLLGGGLLLLYFTTLRLSHFSSEPAIANTTIELILLIAVVVLNLAVSIRRQSPYLVGLNITLAFLTALAGGGSVFALTMMTATVLAATSFSTRYRWPWILTLGIGLSYFTHLLWSLNSPLFGNTVQWVSSLELNLLFILLYATIFAVGSLRQSTAKKEDALSTTNAVLNGFGSFVLLTMLAFTAFRHSFAFWNLAASGLYLSLAIAFWIRKRSQYATFIYAMLGYVALSIALANVSASPDVFVWLCWQSILVLSTAVWFRSRFIVVTNFVIFLLIFIAYLSLAGTIGVISISFGLVALLSARILNWKKDRLELKTELMRNSYLASALFVLPYALYHVVPPGYVSLSWLGLALFYYLASRLLKNNRKYRWMALLTTILTVLYVFTIELVGLDPTLRVISFLILGSALLTVSMIYSRRRRKT